MSVFLQEIPARACQLYFGDFKEKQFSSDATAVIHTEVASSNKVSWRDALCCLSQSSPLPLQPVPVCLGGGEGEWGANLVVVGVCLSGGILIFPNTFALLFPSFWDFGPALTIDSHLQRLHSGSASAVCRDPGVVSPAAMSQRGPVELGLFMPPKYHP